MFRDGKVAALLWCCACVFTIVVFIPRTNDAVQSLFLTYFQPMLPLAFAVWLWGHNVQRFGALSIDYGICFSAVDRKLLPSYGSIYRIALALTTICLTCAAAFAVLSNAGLYAAADFAPVAMYFCSALLLVAPVDVLSMPSRLFFGETLQRVLLPLQEVSWSDFLLADIMTSLSKSGGDLAKAAAAMMAGPTLHMLAARGNPAAGAHMPDPLALPVLCALCAPYAIRLVQCLLVARATGNRSQLLNALKYATAFPALLLTAAEHEYHVAGRPYPHFRWWLGALALNSLYSFYWDLEMDWDMPWLVQPGARHFLRVVRLPALKPDAFYRRGWYVWAVGSNLVLRLGWAHRLVGRLEARSEVALGMALLEVFRRYQWTFIRVETEIRKIRLKQAHEHPVNGLKAGHEAE
ncbi:hypothetical protein GPECTOR_56g430 [Gonium pectorale]|uniref:EXS domain-containing protein n=1 Tax=Gonium pectorale TaxID=33097 RepID=A0A150G6E1_GONPE|nr:hypothetical protein GPECTOR_56g430 [Gonium pectorale]|eukprot:KXZ45333.1 hypothetical protein GPECTOR_56g430 [Gonium pectorale]